MAQKGKKVPGKSFLEKTLGWGIILVFLVLPLVYFPGRAASYVTSKQYFLIGIVDVLAVLWVWLLLSDRRYRLTKRNLFVLGPLFLFLLALTVSAFTGVDPATSFFSTVESGTGLILLYHAFLFSCIITSFIRVQQKTFLKYILQVNLFASAVLAGMTFFTGPNGLFDVHSTMLNGSSGGATMGNSLLVGAYFIFSIFLTLYLIVYESKTWKKVLYWLGIAIMVVCPIYLNASILKGQPLSSSYFFIGEARIATVALGVGLIAAFFIWLCTNKDNKARRTIGMIGIIGMVLIGGVAVQQVASPASRVHAFFVKESGNRIIDWQAAIQGIKEKPVLGWGQENFHVVYQRYFNPIVLDPQHGSEAWALHPHGNTLEILINGGVIGFVAYLFVLVSLFISINTLRKKNIIDGKTFALLIGMLIAFILQQQMVYDSIGSYTMFFFIIALVAGLSDPITEKESGYIHVGNSAYAIGIAIIIVMFPVWLYGAYFPAQKMNEFQSVASARSDARIAAYHHLFYSPGSYAINTDIEFYTSPLFYSYQLSREMIKSTPAYQKIAVQETDALLSAVAPLWVNRPYDYHLTLSLVQIENLQFYFSEDPVHLKNADIYAKRAFALAPNDPQIYFANAQTLVYEHDTPGAIAILNKALALYPAYAPALDFKKKLE